MSSPPEIPVTEGLPGASMTSIFEGQPPKTRPMILPGFKPSSSFECPQASGMEFFWALKGNGWLKTRWKMVGFLGVRVSKNRGVSPQIIPF